MLLATKEKNGKYLELHTLVPIKEQDKELYLIEIYNCTPNGKIYEKSVYIEKEVFDLLVD